MMVPLCNDTKNIFSVATEKKFVSPYRVITNNKNQGRKERIEIPRVSLSGEPNTMAYHRNTLIYSNEGMNKASNTDQNIKVRLVNPESKFVCHDGGITTSRDQVRKLGLDISRVSTFYDSNIIGHYRNVILPDGESDKVSKTYLDTDSKPNIDITKCAK